MAEDIRPGTTVVLADGSERVIRPVSLRQLRKLRKALEKVKFDGVYPSDEDIDGMIDAAVVILDGTEPKLTKSEVEDAVDIKVFNVMVAAAMGADPNELAGMTNQG